MSAITAKASRKMKKYAVLTREPRCFLGSFDFSWEQRKVQDVADRFDNLRIPVAANLRVHGTTPYYGANGIQDYVEGYTHDGEFVLVAEDGANDLKNYPVKCVNGRIWVNNHAHILQGKAGIADNSFLAFAISQSDIESLLVGGGRAKLNAGGIFVTHKERTPEVTHKIMSAIKSKDTKPELLLRKALWKNKIRYRVNYKKLPGKPDIVITKYKIVIFCDGDFWHGHNWAIRGKKSLEEELQDYSDYWRNKIIKNVERDNKNTKLLYAMGWKVIRIWESDIEKNLDECVNTIKEAIFDEELKKVNFDEEYYD